MLPSILFAAQEAIEVWTVREYWGQLTTGMTERVAIDLLGEPKEKESTSTSCIWYYAETPDRDGDKITRRPKYGILMFRLSASSEAMLLRWQEPDWTIITPHTEKQYLADLQRIETELKAEESKRQNQEMQQIQQAEAERKQAVLQQQMEQQRQQAEQQRIKMEQVRQERLANAPPPQEKSGIDMSSSDTAGRYFIYSGIAFGVMAILICCVQGAKFFMWSK